MRGLSIKQPWIDAITYGPKRVENRSWAAPRWILGETVALHASASADWGAPVRAWTAAGITPHRPGQPRKPWLASMTLGAVVAVAVIDGCHLSPDFGGTCGATRPLCSPWAVRDRYHWLLANVRQLGEPVPCRGALGLWRLPEDVEEAVRKQLEGSDG